MTEDGVSAPSPFTLGARRLDAPFALGDVPRTWGDLLSDAAALHRRLPTAPADQPMVMVACGDRYFSAVALLASWHAGRIVALPPNGSPLAIDTLCAAEGIPLVLHDGGGGGGLDIRRISDDWGTDQGEQRQRLPPLSIPPERDLVCVYTSGSTGAPLACRKSAAQILGEARLLIDLFALGAEARILATVPPYHIYGLLFGLLVPLLGGATVVRATPHHAETIAEQAARWRVTVLVSVPAHLHGLSVLAPGALAGLSHIFSSGAPLPEPTANQTRARVGVSVTEVFGSSETGGIAWRKKAGEGNVEEDEAWQPMPGVVVEADREGTIVVHSPFARRAPGDDRPFPRHVGADRVAMRADGRFHLLGRTDGVVKIGGSRTSTAEIERLIREIPGVSDAVVVSVDVPGPRQHELWAVVAAPVLSAAELRAALSRVVDPIAVPRRFRIVAALPREETGKLVRQRVLALFANVETDAAPATGRQLAGKDAAGWPDRQVVNAHFSTDSPYFQGHFEGFPVLPGVVQVNNLVLRQIRARWPGLRHLRRIVALKFRSPIRPGDTISIELTRSESDKVTFQLRGAGGTMVSSGTMIFQQAPTSTSPSGRETLS